MTSRAHIIPAELKPGDPSTGRKGTLGGPPTNRRLVFGAAALASILSLFIGIWIAQYGGPWAIRNQSIDKQLGMITANPTEVLAAFSLMIFGAVGLGLLASKRLPTLRIPDHFPQIRLKTSLTGSILIILASLILIFLCVQVSTGRGVFWYPILLAFTLVLSAAGVTLCDATPTDSAPEKVFGWIDLFLAGVLAAVVIWVATREITDWYFAWIGDEGAFFLAARYLAQGGTLNIFDLTNVYETHPVADTFYQSVFLRIFGQDIVGWRLAEVAVTAITSILIYVVVVSLVPNSSRTRTMGVRLPAAIGALALGSSAFTMAFCHIGYNNLHAMVLPVLVMLVLSLLARRPRAVYLLVLGWILGFCLYTFLAAILTWIVLAAYLLLGIRRAPLRPQITAMILVAVGFATVVLPVIVTDPAQLLAGYENSHSVGLGSSAFQMQSGARGLARTIITFWHNDQWFRHFVAGPLLGPVAGGLAIIGLVAACFVQRRSPGDRFLLLWFFIPIVIIALTNYTDVPSFTRLHFVMPAAALLASRGAMVLIVVLRDRLRLAAIPVAIILVALIAAIPVINARQLYEVVPERLTVDRQSLTIRALQEFPDRPVIEVASEIQQNRDLMVSFYPWYDERHSWLMFEDLESAAPTIDPTAIFLAYDGETAQRVRAVLGDHWRQWPYPDRYYPGAIFIFTPAEAEVPVRMDP